jgi:hypothetical protein
MPVVSCVGSSPRMHSPGFQRHLLLPLLHPSSCPPAFFLSRPFRTAATATATAGTSGSTATTTYTQPHGTGSINVGPIPAATAGLLGPGALDAR